MHQDWLVQQVLESPVLESPVPQAQQFQAQPVSRQVSPCQASQYPQALPSQALVPERALAQAVTLKPRRSKQTVWPSRRKGQRLTRCEAVAWCWPPMVKGQMGSF